MIPRSRLHRFAGADLEAGCHHGTTVRCGRLVIDGPTVPRGYVDPHAPLGAPEGEADWEQATWTSPELSADFAATDLVPSWNAVTPPGTWVEVEASATTTTGTTTGWFVLARWAEDDRDIRPTSVPGQQEEAAECLVDRVCARGEETFASWRLRLRLVRRTGSTESPAVSLVAVAAARPSENPPAPVVPADGAGRSLELPAFSQQVHRGRHLRWGGGGEAWCSAASTAMVLEYWGVGPKPDEYGWLAEDTPDRPVVHAARAVYDHSFGGTGNWAFNTAYAARRGAVAFVTRLRSLAEVQAFVDAGVPLVLSVRFTPEELDGAGYATDGHLLVVAGYDGSGRVVCYDPASGGVARNDRVRTTYDPGQLSRAWLGRTGGLVYVIHPADHPLPPTPDAAGPAW